MSDWNETSNEEKGLKDDNRLSLFMRAERQGNAAKKCLLELIRCQGLYSHWSVYDKAPEVAQQIFADLPQDPNVINERFALLYRNGDSGFSQRELAAANFYGMIGTE